MQSKSHYTEIRSRLKVLSHGDDRKDFIKAENITSLQHNSEFSRIFCVSRLCVLCDCLFHVKVCIKTLQRRMFVFFCFVNVFTKKLKLEKYRFILKFVTWKNVTTCVIWCFTDLPGLENRTGWKNQIIHGENCYPKMFSRSFCEVYLVCKAQGAYVSSALVHSCRGRGWRRDLHSGGQTARCPPRSDSKCFCPKLHIRRD